MEKWEYGSLFTLYPQFAGTMSGPVCVFQTGAGERVMEHVGLSAFNELGMDGWIIDSAGPLLSNPPDWLMSAAFSPASAVRSAQWSIQFSRRRIS
ncbi:hypothetical protein ACN27B_18675 [Micromonospora sp. WMMD754]|uniref:hypothetical protein n=1 Tax=Micromonospora sp. WMMD754 TaxID=3404114 RepID=UPI003BF478FF